MYNITQTAAVKHMPLKFKKTVGREIRDRQSIIILVNTDPYFFRCQKNHKMYIPSWMGYTSYMTQWVLEDLLRLNWPRTYLQESRYNVMRNMSRVLICYDLGCHKNHG